MHRLMLKRYREQRHIDLDRCRSCLALEREYWKALEVLTYEDGRKNSYDNRKLAIFNRQIVNVRDPKLPSIGRLQALKIF